MACNFCHMCAFRNSKWLEAARPFCGIVTCYVGMLASAKGFYSTIGIGAICPHIVIFLRSPDLLCFVALWQLEFERIVLIVFLIVSALLELSPEHVARCEDSSTLCCDNSEVLPTADIDHLVTLLVSEIGVLNLMELIMSRSTTTSKAEHILATLTMPEKFAFLCQHKLEEFAMSDLFEVTHSFWRRYFLKLCLLIALSMASIAEIPYAFIASNKHDRAVHGDNFDCSTLCSILKWGETFMGDLFHATVTITTNPSCEIDDLWAHREFNRG